MNANQDALNEGTESTKMNTSSIVYFMAETNTDSSSSTDMADSKSSTDVAKSSDTSSNTDTT
jgi:hypothetical protein